MNFLRRTLGLTNEDNINSTSTSTSTSTKNTSNNSTTNSSDVTKSQTNQSSANNNNKNDDEVRPPDHQPEDGSVGATLWSMLSSKLGGDVLTAGISLPSWIYEPLSILQRGAEMIEYGETLTSAANCVDPVERLAYIAGFAVSGYSATQRYKPDFNPILGETFEFVDSRNNTLFFAEQVSHHPPISALHAINAENWVFWQNSSPTTKFLGNCMDLDTRGKSHILFPKTGEHYFYTNPQCTRIHNIILGSMWIEHFGALAIKNLDGSMSCTVNFKKSGIFQGTQYKVEGYIEDKSGKRLVKLYGRWNESLEGKWLVDTVSVKKGETRKLWTIASETFLHDQYNFTQFTVSLNAMDGDLEEYLLPTDSRRRLDRRNLEKGDTDTATYWKKVMEDRQRIDRKYRKDAWQPVWFKKISLDDNNGEGKSMWIYNGDYWDQRKRNEALVKEGKKVVFLPSPTTGLACDFTSYTHNDTNDADTITDPTDTATITATDDRGGQDDTDTETELDGWSPDGNANCNAADNSSTAVTSLTIIETVT